MKSSFLIVLSIIGVSIACTAYKSVGSQPLANNNAQTQPSVQTNTATAQEQEKTPCTLTLAGAPLTNGLRLGMTADEVLALFPGSKDDAEVRTSLARPPGRFGMSEFLIRPAKYELNEKSGVSQIAVTLLDGHASRFYIGYDGPQYSHVDKFVAKFIEGKNLPAVDQWEAYVGMDTQLKTLNCKDFQIKIFAGGKGGNLNYVDIRDLEADKKLQERERKAEAEASPTPKP